MVARSGEVVAAGAVVFAPRRQVLLVHRPKYDDWSFPKGKLERYEHRTAAAVREVAEETGLHIRLGPPLSDQEYPVGTRAKRVHYWTARVVGDDDVEGYRFKDEIDRVAWVPWEAAHERLSYDFDRDTLAEAIALRLSTRAIVVLRHAEARSRSRWHGPDAERPLLVAGRRQAERLVPILAAYGVERVVASSSTRCVETVAPFAAAAGLSPTLTEALAEEGAAEGRAESAVDDVLASTREPVLLCTHRPVLPRVLWSAGVRVDRPLAPGELVVVHERHGRVVSWERHGR